MNIKVTLYLIFFVVLLSGCATWFPAAVQEIEEGVYSISATGNSFASQEKMRLKVNKKAEAICQGKGYEKVEKESVKWAEQKDYVNNLTTSYQVMSMTITCKE